MFTRLQVYGFYFFLRGNSVLIGLKRGLLCSQRKLEYLLCMHACMRDVSNVFSDVITNEIMYIVHRSVNRLTVL